MATCTVPRERSPATIGKVTSQNLERAVDVTKLGKEVGIQEIEHAIGLRHCLA